MDSVEKRVAEQLGCDSITLREGRYVVQSPESDGASFAENSLTGKMYRALLAAERRTEELMQALVFCRDRLEFISLTMSESEGLAGYNLNGVVAPWSQIDEPMMVEAGVEVANRVLAGGTFAL